MKKIKIIGFAASNSSSSINHQLVSYALKLVDNSEVIKLTDYIIPIYSEDLEKSEGIPQSVKDLNAKLTESDKIIISVNEHNGNISAFFKNILDELFKLHTKSKLNFSFMYTFLILKIWYFKRK